MIQGCAIILGSFLGCSRIFGYLFGLFPDFWVSFFLVNDILSMTLWNVACRALVSYFLQSDLTYSCKKQ